MLAEIQRHKAEDPAGVQKSNDGGWHSNGGILRTAFFSKLAERITTEVERINPHVWISGGWANVNPPGCANARHNHAKAILSGVFYLQAPEDSGNLILEDPREAAQMLGGLPDILLDPVEIPAQAGVLLIFPAWLPHRVGKNCSGKDRISVAFNVLPRWLPADAE